MSEKKEAQSGATVSGQIEHHVDSKNFPMAVGSKSAISDGYRVIGNDTSTGRPWVWFSPDLDTAKLLSKTLCEFSDQDVMICKCVGVMRRVAPPVEYEEAPDASESATASSKPKEGA